METRHAMICIHNEMNDGLSASGVLDKFKLSNLYIHASMKQTDIERKKENPANWVEWTSPFHEIKRAQLLKAGTEWLYNCNGNQLGECRYYISDATNSLQPPPHIYI